MPSSILSPCIADRLERVLDGVELECSRARGSDLDLVRALELALGTS
jgi:hypothetical protein